MVGSVDEHGATLRKQIAYRNSFQSILKVEFAPAQGGTRLVCRSGMDMFIVIFLMVWFGGMLFFGGAVSLSGGAGGNAGYAVIFPILIGAGGLFLVRFGRSLAQADEEFLMRFLAQITHARPAQ